MTESQILLNEMLREDPELFEAILGSPMAFAFNQMCRMVDAQAKLIAEMRTEQAET